MSNAPTSLCPGYRHVDAFGPDEDYEDEEVSYVTLDLGSIEPTLVPSSSSYRLIGLDSPTPFLQLSGTILKGRHDSLLGTELLFTEDKETHDWNKRSLIYTASTEQRICFKEVRLQPKIHPSETMDGHEDENEPIAIAPEAGAPAEGEKIDRLTGKTVVSTRAARGGRKPAKGKGKKKQRELGDEDEEMEEVVEEKQAVRRSSRGKGKEKEKEQEQEQERMNVDEPEDDIDDMYT